MSNGLGLDLNFVRNFMTEVIVIFDGEVDSESPQSFIGMLGFFPFSSVSITESPAIRNDLAVLIGGV